MRPRSFEKSTTSCPPGPAPGIEYLPVRERPESIMVAKYTDDNGMSFGDIGLKFSQEATQMKSLMFVIEGIRNIRGELNVNPSVELEVFLNVTGDALDETAYNANELLIRKLARLKAVTIKRGLTPPRGAAKAVTPGCEIYVPLEGIVDIDAEAARLRKEIDKAVKEMKPFEAKLANEGFVKKAPPEILEKTRGIIAELTQKKEKLEEGLKRLEGMK